MAISITTLPVGSFGFMLNSTSANVSACEVLLAAPGTGLSIYVDQLIINSTDAIGISFGEGESVPGTLDTTLIGEIQFAALATLSWDFRSRGGLKITANTLIGIDADGAGVINCFVSGRIV